MNQHPSNVSANLFYKEPFPSFVGDYVEIILLYVTNIH